jgi:sugar lactone lactonase YvrE
VKVFKPDGTLNQTLNTGTNATFTTGSAFDSSGNFYVTTFSGNVVSKFDNNGNLINGNFATGFNANPESISFDKAGNFYVGQADGARTIKKFDPTGTNTATFSPTVGPRGTDWVDLAADQRTIYYTSEGNIIRRFDTSTNTQLTNFNQQPLPDGAAYALRILPDGGVAVANTNQIVRLDSTGAVVRTYTTADTFLGEPISTLFALNIDPDGTSFWTADLGTSNVYRVDIASGNILSKFNSGGTAAGLSIFGEFTSGGGGGGNGGSTSVPGPLPVLGAATAFGFSRKLRKRIKSSMLPVASAID